MIETEDGKPIDKADELWILGYEPMFNKYTPVQVVRPIVLGYRVQLVFMQDRRKQVSAPILYGVASRVFSSETKAFEALAAGGEA